MLNGWIEPGPPPPLAPLTAPPPLAPTAPSARAPGAPRVSIVMPTYRRAGLIGLTIRTILRQSYGDFELLVRDDGSGDDGTKEAVLAAAEGDPRVHYHRNPTNLRMPANLNAGITEARGELIAVCHDHDLFAPRYLEVLVALLDRHPSALYAHCGIAIVDQRGEPLGIRHIAPFAELTRGRDFMPILLRDFHCPVCALTLVRRRAHERYGLYHPAYGFIADVEMWMRLAEAGDVAYAAEPLVDVRTREDDHAANIDPWPMLATVFAIHRRYIPRHYHGIEGLKRSLELAARADATFVREILSGIRRGRRPSLGPSADKLRVSAGPLGRRLASLLSP